MGVDTCYPIATAAVRRASNSDNLQFQLSKFLEKDYSLSQEEPLMLLAVFVRAFREQVAFC